jgi:hypothetical protein
VYVESSGDPLTQRLGIFTGEEILTFVFFATVHTLPNGRQGRLDSPLEQGLITPNIHAARVLLFQLVPRTHPWLSKCEKKAYSLLNCTCRFLTHLPSDDDPDLIAIKLRQWLTD